MLAEKTTPENHKSSNHNRLLVLDALRGIAALLVLLFHFSLGHKDTTYPFFRFGVTGVDLFFIISGFVIMMSLERIRFGYEFIINRFCRLFPTYWMCVTLTLIIIMLCAKTYTGSPATVPWAQYFANMTMFQFYLGHKDLDGPYWTMLIEMLFYLVMLTLFYDKALRSVVFILVAMVLSMTLLIEKYIDNSFTWNYLQNFPLMQFLPLFLAGILFYKLYNQEKKSFLYILLILGCYLAQVLLYKYSGRSFMYVSHPEYKLTLGIYFILFFLFLFKKLRFIVNKPTLFLGKISFALYLIHQYLGIDWLIPMCIDNGIDYFIAAFLIALPICSLLAVAVTYFVEIPSQKWLKPALYSLANYMIVICKRMKIQLTRKEVK